jgi:hypothetical protein
MTGSTTHFHLPYVDPSQSEPEVPINAALDIVDAELETLSTVTGAPLTVHDGSTSVANVVDLLLTGAVVTSPSAGHAVATIAGGGGGGGSGNLTPDTPPASPNALDDEFTGAAGDPIDVKWTWHNQGGATAVQDGQGACALVAPSDSVVFNARYLGQAISGSAWRVRAKLNVGMYAAYNNAGILAYESSSGKTARTSLLWDGSAANNYTVQVSALGGSGSGTTTTDTGLKPIFNVLEHVYLELELASGTIYARASRSGYDGSFKQVGTLSVSSAFTTGPDTIGIFSEAQSATAMTAWFDWFRRMA